MDRYICRAKDVNTGKWVQGYPARLDYITNELFFIGPEFVIHVDQDTICQCTGYYDSHDTLIFENDIIGFGREDSYRHKELVWYCREMNMLTSVPLDGIEFNGYDYWNGKYPNVEFSTLCLMLQDPYGDFSDIKVLGNIIDNPELIEEYR